MTHKRTQIREAVAEALTGLTTCVGNVFPSRVRPLSPEELPAILVSTLGEEVPVNTLSGVFMQRDLSMRLEIVVKEADGFEATADAVLEDIEGRLFDTIPHNTLDGLVRAITLASIGDPEMDDSTEKPVVRLPVYLRVVYS